MAIFIAPFVSGYSIYYGDYNPEVLQKHIDVPVSATNSDMTIGVVGTIRIGIIQDGNGKIIFDQRIYVDEESLPSIIDAIKYTESITQESNYDYFISYDLMSQKVSGRSSSSAIAFGLVSLIKDITVNNTLVTGEIDSMGNIKETGGLLIKVKAAVDHGIKEMYVPSTQTIIPYYEKNGNMLLRKELDLVEYGRESNLEVVGINNINEVLKQKV